MTFHLYGFIIAIAIIVAVSLVEKKAKKIGISEDYFWETFFWILIGGIIGARVWHVLTDLQLYLYDFWGIFKVWNGGLSILGAIAGGVIALRLKLQILNSKSQVPTKKILDLAVFGLPFGQAIGRLANYFNQELYGLPTDLPWGIYIDPKFRVSNFEFYERYHPLFAYEAITMLTFGIVIWFCNAELSGKQKNKNWQIGSGRYFLIYLIYYSVVRFLLDFLRVYHQPFFNTIFTRNQIILLLFWFLVLSWFLIFKYKNRGMR